MPVIVSFAAQQSGLLVPPKIAIALAVPAPATNLLSELAHAPPLSSKKVTGVSV